MLKAMRDGAKSGFLKIILMGLMTLAVFGLVLTDVGGFFRGGIPATTVATVGKSEISTRAFDQQVRRVLAQQGLDPATAYQYGFIQQILYSKIGEHLFAMRVRDLGILVTDSIVKRHITELVKPYVTDTLSPADALRRIVYNQGMTEPQFIEAIRSEIQNTVLRNALQDTAYVDDASSVSPIESDLYKYRNETRKVSYFSLPDSSIAYADIEKPTDEILHAEYENNKADFIIPELRSFSYVTLSQKQVEDALEISDETAQAYYEDNIDHYTVPEQRKIAQAILPDEALASVVADRARRGGSVKDAVEKETGMSDGYIGEDYFERGSMIADVADIVFEAEQGTVPAPVKTALGWHVFKVNEIKPSFTPTFASLKQDIKDELKREQMADEIYVMANAIDDRLASGEPLKDLADAMSLPYAKITDIRVDGSTTSNTDGMKAFGDEDRNVILDTAFDLLEMESSPVMELSDGRFLALQVDSVQSSSYKSFETVRKTVEEQYIAAQRADANLKRAAEAVRLSKEDGKSLSDVAASLGTSVKSVSLVQKEDAPESLGRVVKKLVFDSDINDTFSVPVDKAVLVAKIDTVSLPDTDKLAPEDVADISGALANNANSEIMALFMGYLHEDYKVKVNDRVLDMMYGQEQEF